MSSSTIARMKSTGAAAAADVLSDSPSMKACHRYFTVHGARARWTAPRKVVLFSPQGDDRIDCGGAAGRHVARRGRHDDEEDCRSEEAERIGGAHVVEQAGDHARDAERTDETGHDPERGQTRAVADDEPEHAAPA